MLTHSTIASIALRDSALVEQYQDRIVMNKQVQAIRAEIERRMKEYDAIIAKWAECKSLLSFIDSLPDEQQNIEPISSSGIANNTSIDTSNEQPYHP